MKPKTLLITTVLTGIAIIAPTTLSAKEKQSTSPNLNATASAEASPALNKTRAFPYHGKVASIDASARTFTIGKRTFGITNDTKITKDGATATISDITSGQMVGGSYWKKDDGTLEARTVKIGSKSMAVTPATDSQKENEKRK
jgi:hypothetical protein